MEPMAHWSVYKGDVEIPYWRIVGTYGYISDDSRAGGRERQINNLEAEGLFIELCGAGNKSKRVRDFKHHLFDLSQVDTDTIKSAGFGNTIHSVMLDMMLDPGMYRVLSVSQLKQFAGYNETTEPSEKLQWCAELAKAELTRRGIAFPEGDQT